jgi:hypothetical protein
MQHRTIIEERRRGLESTIPGTTDRQTGRERKCSSITRRVSFIIRESVLINRERERVRLRLWSGAQ